MSEAIRWPIMAIIAAAILIWGFSAWRNRRDLGRLSSTDDAHPNPFWQRHPMLPGLMALSLAGLAQYALGNNQPEFAALGYLCATLLFISALRQFMPITLLDQTPFPAAEPKTETPQPEPAPALPAPDLLTDRHPGTPSSAVIESVPATVAALTADLKVASDAKLIAVNPSTDTIEPGPPLSSSTSNADLAPERTSTHSAAEVTAEKRRLEPMAGQVWTGFGRPQGLGVTPNGNVLVLDGARQRVYCLDPLGTILREWALPEMPKLQDYRVAFSPDGQKLYLADPVQGQVYSFTLNEDQL